MRLLGPLAGVTFRTDLADAARKTSPWEVYDCRLVLSMWDFSQILRAHAVEEVRIFSAYRPPPKHQDEQASKRHQAALAVDVRTLRKSNGEELAVLTDFEQKLGTEPCAPTDEPSRPAGKELKAITCETARAHLFNSILTPNYDARHRNHFHLEVAPGKPWFLLR
ncbi:MAG: extensin family protein [Polyangiaceae bacterium]